MLIVIEGPDGAGKTTLIEQLRKNSRQYFFVVRSAAPPPDRNATDRYLDGLRQFSWRVRPDHVVCDRFQPVSESIYGPIVRNTSFTRRPLDFVDVDMIVYCRPPYPVILEGTSKTEQMDGVNSRMSQLVEAYDKLLRHDIYQFAPELMVIEYDRTRWTSEQLSERIFS